MMMLKIMRECQSTLPYDVLDMLSISKCLEFISFLYAINEINFAEQLQDDFVEELFLVTGGEVNMREPVRALSYL